MDMNLSKLQETMKDRKAWHAEIHAKSQIGLNTNNSNNYIIWGIFVVQSQPHGLQCARIPHPTVFRRLLKLMSIESVMPSKHLILCRPLLLLPPFFPSIRVFSNELALIM